jgi:hypothetical protein
MFCIDNLATAITRSDVNADNMPWILASKVTETLEPAKKKRSGNGGVAMTSEASHPNHGTRSHLA